MYINIIFQMEDAPKTDLFNVFNLRKKHQFNSFVVDILQYLKIFPYVRF